MIRTSQLVSGMRIDLRTVRLAGVSQSGLPLEP